MAWKADKATVEQKRRYWALVAGYKIFWSKCVTTNDDIVHHVLHWSKEDNSKNYCSSHEHTQPFRQLDKSIGTEQCKMATLLELLHDGGVGYMPQHHVLPALVWHW